MDRPITYNQKNLSSKIFSSKKKDVILYQKKNNFGSRLLHRPRKPNTRYYRPKIFSQPKEKFYYNLLKQGNFSNKNFLRTACCTDLAYPIKSSFQFKGKTSFCFPKKAPNFQQKCFLRLSCLKERIIQPNLKNPRVVQLPGKQKISNTCLGNYFFFYFHEKIKSLYFRCVSNTGILYFSKI